MTGGTGRQLPGSDREETLPGRTIEPHCLDDARPAVAVDAGDDPSHGFASPATPASGADPRSTVAANRWRAVSSSTFQSACASASKPKPVVSGAPSPRA